MRLTEDEKRQMEIYVNYVLADIEEGSSRRSLITGHLNLVSRVDEVDNESLLRKLKRTDFPETVIRAFTQLRALYLQEGFFDVESETYRVTWPSRAQGSRGYALNLGKNWRYLQVLNIEPTEEQRSSVCDGNKMLLIRRGDIYYLGFRRRGTDGAFVYNESLINLEGVIGEITEDATRWESKIHRWKAGRYWNLINSETTRLGGIVLDEPVMGALADHAKTYLEEKIAARQKSSYELFEDGLLAFGESCKFGSSDRKPFWRTLAQSRKESTYKLIGNAIPLLTAPAELIIVGSATAWAAAAAVAAATATASTATATLLAAAAPAVAAGTAAPTVAGAVGAAGAAAAAAVVVAAGIVATGTLDHSLDTPEKRAKLRALPAILPLAPEFDGAAIRAAASMWIEAECTLSPAVSLPASSAAEAARPAIGSGIRFLGGGAAAAAATASTDETAVGAAASAAACNFYRR